MRVERNPMGVPINVKDGEHVLIADDHGDPACACGYRPRAATPLQAAGLIRQHIQKQPTTEVTSR
jgi:hypothetical protein